MSGGWGDESFGNAILLASEIIVAAGLETQAEWRAAAQAVDFYRELERRGDWWLFVQDHDGPQDYLFYSWPIQPQREDDVPEGWDGFIAVCHHPAASTYSVRVTIDHHEHADLEPTIWFPVGDPDQLGEVLSACQRYRWGDPMPREWIKHGTVIEITDDDPDRTRRVDELRAEPTD